MKITLLIVPAVLVLALLAACEQESRPRNPEDAPNGGGGTIPASTPTPTPMPVAETTPTPTPTPSESVPPTPTPTPTTVRNIPYATPVPGKPGFVISPHSPNSGYVDVRGFGPGMEVKDPFSGQVFLVP